MSLTSDQCQILNAIKNKDPKSNQHDCEQISNNTGLDINTVRANLQELIDMGLIKGSSYRDAVLPETLYIGCQLEPKGHVELQQYK